jgi:hypothetical protein
LKPSQFAQQRAPKQVIFPSWEFVCLLACDEHSVEGRLCVDDVVSVYDQYIDSILRFIAVFQMNVGFHNGQARDPLDDSSETESRVLDLGYSESAFTAFKCPLCLMTVGFSSYFFIYS